MKMQQRRPKASAFGKAAVLRKVRAGRSRIAWLPVTVAALACAPLLGCAYERPQSTTTPGLETGITSSNGGGTRTLGNQPNIGITTRVGPGR